MVYLDERLVRMQTFKDKLFSQSGNGLIKQSLIQKEALVAVLSRALTGANRSTPRGTKELTTLAKIIHHFGGK